jgi:hypothetical protein
MTNDERRAIELLRQDIDRRAPPASFWGRLQQLHRIDDYRLLDVLKAAGFELRKENV